MSDPPPQLNLNLESTNLSLPLSLPATPTSPLTDTKSKKSNPLNDLIDTEKAYTDLLGGIIKKVAAAWSRHNMPPKKLDKMFRSIEAVYRSNRGLLSKLKEIGTTSPKALGDLLIRWVDDLEGPYTAYCTQYSSGFDNWDPVQSNERLGPILATFSEANPPPGSDSSLWTLDDLFLLPKGRLKYYKKLYSRLLKNTQPGRSDHRLLLDALEKLEKLLKVLEEQRDVKVSSPVESPPRSLPPGPPPQLEDTPAAEKSPVREDAKVETARRSDPDLAPESEGSSVRGSGGSGFDRMSQDAPSSSTSRNSSSTLTSPVTDLERRLLTQKTLDIFTMTPKSVRLQMAPAALTFTREFRCSLDINIRFTPRSTGVEVVHERGHIFLLSDLFLICERMSPQDFTEHGSNGADMWLVYPPLSGKVLRVSDVPGQDTAVQVHIMRKEVLILTADSVDARNNFYSQLKECIEFATSIGPISKQPPPPVPPLPGLTQSNSAPLPTLPVSPSQSRDSQNSHTSSDPRTSSPPSLNGNRGSQRSSNNPERDISPRSSGGVESVNGQFSGMSTPLRQMASPPPSIGPGQVFRNPSMTGGPAPSIHGIMSPLPTIDRGQIFGPPRASSAGPTGQGPPLGHLMGGPHPMYGPNHPNGPQPHNFPPGPGPPPHMFAPQPVHRSYGPMGEGSLPSLPPRPPSEPNYHVIHKSPSTRSLNAPQLPHQQPRSAPPLPNMPPGGPGLPPGPGMRPGGPGGPGYPSMNGNFMPPRPPALSMNMNGLQPPNARPTLPSSQFKRAVSNVPSFADPSPPSSPVEETPKFNGPTTLTISANMKCKVFLKQQHQQWKSLGGARLKVYRQSPTNIKQLVVENESKDRQVLISTIVLSDGVERVGKTGVAIELSDQGVRTGIVYMLQLRSDEAAGGLFDSLLEGSDRSGLK